MKSLSIILAYSLTQFIFGFFTDMSWWIFIPITMITTIIAKQTLSMSNKSILWIIFNSTLVLWFIYSLVINVLNHNKLYTMVGGVFGLPNGYLLVIIQALFGGLISLIATWVTLQFFVDKKKERTYRKF